MADYKGSNTPEEIREFWQTPDWLFIPLDHEFVFGLDAAATHLNAKVPAFLTEKENALLVDWSEYIIPFAKRSVWLNPPFSNIQPWIEKAVHEARSNNLTTVMLVPATPDAGWWPDNASEIRFIVGCKGIDGKRNISGRVHYVRADTGEEVKQNPKGSCLMIFSPFTLGNMTTKYIKKIDIVNQYNQIKIALAEKTE
jgi:phage N-6-adenine-methyltransferase